MAMEMDTEKAPILEVSGSVTLEEYIEANRVWHLDSTFGRSVRYRLYCQFGYLIGGAFLVAAAVLFLRYAASLGNGATHHESLAQSGGWLMAGLGLIGISWVSRPNNLFRRLRRSYFQAGFDRECTAKFDEEGLYTARLDGTAESRIKWEAFQHWKESPGLFVLFPSQAQYFWVSKRLLKPGDEDRLRELLAAKIPANEGTQ